MKKIEDEKMKLEREKLEVRINETGRSGTAATNTTAIANAATTVGQDKF